jgi:hypothetical protein
MKNKRCLGWREDHVIIDPENVRIRCSVFWIAQKIHRAFRYDATM